MTRESTTTTDREIVITRLIDAPRDLVFKAWTLAGQLVQWWGSEGFSTTTQEIDAAPDGVWRYVMRAPDGTAYENRIQFREVAEPGRLVYDQGGDSPDDPSRFQTSLTFDDRDGKTELTMRSVFQTQALRDEVVREHGAVDGGEQTLERLARHVENTIIITDDEMIVARTFDAPRELVFKCWTEPEHFVRWWGPHGFDTPSCTIDASVGGVAHFNMRSSQYGMDMWYGRVCQEVTPPSRLVFTEYLADAEGNKASPAVYGMGDSWPGEMLVAIDFVEHEGKTTMVMRVDIGASVPGLEHALGGYGQAFEKLDAYLPTQAA